MTDEEREHKQLADYIKLQYPNVMFNSGMSGVKLPLGLTNELHMLIDDNKKQRSSRTGNFNLRIHLNAKNKTKK